jgi:undecaprenyl pyrophosphate phosphatase UppP
MAGNQRRRFWVEAGLSAATAILAILTLFWREWIELLTGWDPDHGDGSLEWAIVIVLALVAVIFGAMARAEWRQTRPATDIPS